MLIRIFKQGTARNSVWLIILGLALWADAIFFARPALPDANDAAPLYQIVIILLQNLPLLNVLLGLALLIAQMFIINGMCYNYNLLGKSSWLPGFFYLLLMSSHPNYLFLTSGLAANFFLLIAIDRMFLLFEKKDPALEVFNVATLISMAGLFHYSMFLFVFWLMVVIVVYFLPSVRTFASAITGIGFPLVFLVAWYFLNLQLEEEFVRFTERFDPGFLFEESLSLYEKILLFSLAGITTVALFALLTGKIGEKINRVRNRTASIVYFLIFAVVSLLFFQSEIEASHNIIAIPIAVFFAMFFQSIKRIWIADLLVYLFLGLIVFGKLQQAAIW